MDAADAARSVPRSPWGCCFCATYLRWARVDVLQLGGGTFTLRGELWRDFVYDIRPGRYLTIRSGALAAYPLACACMQRWCSCCPLSGSSFCCTMHAKRCM